MKKKSVKHGGKGWMHPLLVSAMVVLAGVAAYLLRVPFLERMELVTMDLRFQMRGPQPTSDQIVLAVIDEKSIDQEGKWVWPRRKFADLVNRLSEAGASVVGFDVGFLETDEQDKVVVRTIDRIRAAATRHADDAGFQDVLRRMREAADQDRLLAHAIATSKARVVLGYFFHALPEESAHLDPKNLAVQTESIATSRFNSTHFPPGMQDQITAGLLQPLSDRKIMQEAVDSRMARIAQVAAPQANIPVISKAAPASGYFNIIPDMDGSVRHIDLFINYRNDLYAPLSLKTTAAHLDKQLFIQVGEQGIQKIKLSDNPIHIDMPGDVPIPTDAEGRMYINYRGPEKSFPHIPITDILNGRVKPADLAGKIVLVGATAIGIYDMRVTPFGSVFPGLEVHANVVDNMLQGDFLERPAWIHAVEVGIMVVLGLLLGYALPRASVGWGTVLAGMIFVGYLAFSYLLFTRSGLIISVVYPLLVVLAIYICITLTQFLSEVRQKRFIREAFTHYLAPSVVKQLIESPEKLELGGEERNITAFFSDLQGFTGISETLGPKQLVELLNAFLTDMTDIILRHEGTVDKFEGDAIIAIFGAPADMPDHPIRACLAALEMQQRLAERRAEWEQKYGCTLWMRIGLCTGNAVVGNMGSKSRMDYTMMGDTVNTAARLETVNKLYGVYSIMNESTREKLGDDIVCRELDQIWVSGKQKSLRIFEIIGRNGEVGDRELKLVSGYESGLALYRERRWAEAAGAFAAVLADLPTDQPSRIMEKRCKELRDHPPGPDWRPISDARMK